MLRPIPVQLTGSLVNPLLIENAFLVKPGESITRGSLLIAAGKIAALNPVSVPPGTDRLDAAGKRGTPGLIDLHTLHLRVSNARAHARTGPARQPGQPGQRSG